MQLNSGKNIVLQIEALRQDDASTIMVEFNNFSMLRQVFDDVKYNMRGFDPKRNAMEHYPIISLGNQTTSSLKTGKFIFLNPAYLKELEEKKKERRKLKDYHDTSYSGFKTFDMNINSECRMKFNVGFWYPYGLRYYGNGVYKDTCQCKYNTYTNLNGKYNHESKANERQIIFCQRSNTEDCVIPDYGTNGLINGWNLNYTTTIKLSETRMWLKRP